MIEESNKSGTYVEFSFEKSLRKYQNLPCKKARQNSLANNQHSTSSQHRLGKVSRKDNIQSQDRKIKIQSSRQNELMRSRYQARQFSETKRRKQLQNSENKSRQSSIKLQTQNSWKKNQVSMILPAPLSEFNVGEQMNLRHLNREEILSLSLNKDVPRFEYLGKSGTKKVKQNEMQNLLSIEKILQRNNLNECAMYHRQNDLSIKKRLDMFGFCSIENNSKIIEEQDESFSQLSLTQSNLVLHSQLILNQQNQIKQQNLKCSHVQDEEQQQYKIPQNPAISYAYFSSCSQVHSFQSQIECNQMQCQEKIKSNQLLNHKQNEIQELNPFQNLKLQSKEELKKQCRNEQRERVFYQIKKIGEVDKAYSECQNISGDIKNELNKQMLNQDIFQNHQSQQPQVLQIKSPQRHIEVNSSEVMKPECENTIQMMEPKSNYQKQNENKGNQTQKTFKRSAPCQLQKNQIQPINFKKKSRKINFEIDQDYQKLGRVRIQGLGQENQSICLSVRRLSKQTQNLTKDLGVIGSLDQNKVISYLISQRPYLEKNKPQLQKLLTMVMSSNRNSIESINRFK